MYVVELPSRRLGVIEEVQTHPGHRKKGYATELIQEALRHAEIWDLDCVELTVREDRPQVQEFYEKLGFKDRQNRSLRYSLKELKKWNEHDT